MDKHDYFLDTAFYILGDAPYAGTIKIKPNLVILKQDMVGYSMIEGRVVVPKGALVDLQDFNTIAISGTVAIKYNRSKRAELFEPLDPDDEL